MSGVLLVFAVLVLLYKRLMSPLVNMTSLALAPLGGILLVWLFAAGVLTRRARPADAVDVRAAR